MKIVHETKSALQQLFVVNEGRVWRRGEDRNGIRLTIPVKTVHLQNKRTQMSTRCTKIKVNGLVGTLSNQYLDPANITTRPQHSLAYFPYHIPNSRSNYHLLSYILFSLVGLLIDSGTPSHNTLSV